MSGKASIGIASAVVLAGGKSSRMGSPKAWLSFAGKPLIVHMVGALEQEFDNVVVVAAPGQKLPVLPVTLVHDAVAFQGPVGGIYYGLQAAVGDVCFVTGCDVPFLQPALIRFLLAKAVDFDVVAPLWQERLQPLQAVYRKTVTPLLKQQLDEERLRPTFLYDRVRTCIVSEEEIRRIDPDGLSFFNVNTPDDYQKALLLWRTQQTKTINP